MLIQIAMNNIEDIEQGEQILRKWQYHLDEDQSYVVLERAVGRRHHHDLRGCIPGPKN